MNRNPRIRQRGCISHNSTENHPPVFPPVFRKRPIRRLPAGLLHTKRNRRYRARQRGVTDQGPATTAREFEAGPSHGLAVDAALPARRESPGHTRCHPCGAPASAFVRRLPLRRRRRRTGRNRINRGFADGVGTKKYRRHLLVPCLAARFPVSLIGSPGMGNGKPWHKSAFNHGSQNSGPRRPVNAPEPAERGAAGAGVTGRRQPGRSPAVAMALRCPTASAV